MPLEEVAAIFGDADEVAIYQRDIEIDYATHTIAGMREKVVDGKGGSGIGIGGEKHLESGNGEVGEKL